MFFKAVEIINMFFPLKLTSRVGCSEILWSRGQLIVTLQVFSQALVRPIKLQLESNSPAWLTVFFSSHNQGFFFANLVLFCCYVVFFNVILI